MAFRSFFDSMPNTRRFSVCWTFPLKVTGLAMACLISGLAMAQDIEWTGTTSVNWTLPGNWSTGVVPAAEDDVWIDTLSPNIAVRSGATTPALGQVGVSNSQPARLEIINGGVLSAQSGRVAQSGDSHWEVLVSGPGSQWNMVGNIQLAVSGNGSLHIENGGVVTNGPGFTSNIGNNPAGVGEVIVTGADSMWQMESGISIGANGTGNLEILDGGAVETTFVGLGAASSANGALTITGPGSRLQGSSGLTVGGGGTGTVHLNNGLIENGSISFIGRDSTAAGSVYIVGADALWQGTALRVGNDGVGEMEIIDGAQVIMNWSTLGDSETGVGTVRVSGAGSEWRNEESSSLSVGREGSGHLEVLDGAYVYSGGGTRFGWLEGSEGTVIVDGQGSLLETQFSAVVGVVGNAVLQLVNGGRMQSSPQINVASNDGEGTVVIGGTVGGPPEAPGVLDVANLIGGDGTASLRLNHAESVYYLTRNGLEDGSWVNLSGSLALIHDGPGTSVIGSHHTHGSTFVRQGEVIMSWGSINHADAALLVGGIADAAGSFVLESGTVTSNSGFLGAVEGAVGQVVLSGPGATWNTNTLTVGGLGSGHLLVEQGAVLNAAFDIAISTASEPQVESTVVANGMITAPTVLVQGMGRLSGNGSIEGLVFSSQDGVIAFGNSGGNLAMNELQLGLEARLELHASGSPGNSDWLFVDGDVQLNGELDLIDAGGLSTGRYTLIEYTGVRSGFGIALGQLPPGVNAVIVEDETNKRVYLDVLGEKIFSDRFEGG
ncbi:MAG: hypothetical protein LAT56_03000 [Wenzhouxiangella sp.]|nr:hypothetical protein [Wenzhouxiangella sp.]